MSGNSTSKNTQQDFKCQIKHEVIANPTKQSQRSISDLTSDFFNFNERIKMFQQDHCANEQNESDSNKTMYFNKRFFSSKEYIQITTQLTGMFQTFTTLNQDKKTQNNSQAVDKSQELQCLLKSLANILESVTNFKQKYQAGEYSKITQQIEYEKEITEHLNGMSQFIKQFTSQIGELLKSRRNTNYFFETIKQHLLGACDLMKEPVSPAKYTPVTGPKNTTKIANYVLKNNDNYKSIQNKIPLMLKSTDNLLKAGSLTKDYVELKDGLTDVMKSAKELNTYKTMYNQSDSLIIDKIFNISSSISNVINKMVESLSSQEKLLAIKAATQGIDNQLQPYQEKIKNYKNYTSYANNYMKNQELRNVFVNNELIKQQLTLLEKNIKDLFDQLQNLKKENQSLKKQMSSYENVHDTNPNNSVYYTEEQVGQKIENTIKQYKQQEEAKTQQLINDQKTKFQTHIQQLENEIGKKNSEIQMLKNKFNCENLQFQYSMNQNNLGEDKKQQLISQKSEKPDEQAKKELLINLASQADWTTQHLQIKDKDKEIQEKRKQLLELQKKITCHQLYNYLSKQKPEVMNSIIKKIEQLKNRSREVSLSELIKSLNYQEESQPTAVDLEKKEQKASQPLERQESRVDLVKSIHGQQNHQQASNGYNGEDTFDQVKETEIIKSTVNKQQEQTVKIEKSNQNNQSSIPVCSEFLQHDRQQSDEKLEMLIQVKKKLKETKNQQKPQQANFQMTYQKVQLTTCNSKIESLTIQNIKLKEKLDEQNQNFEQLKKQLEEHKKQFQTTRQHMISLIYSINFNLNLCKNNEQKQHESHNQINLTSPIENQQSSTTNNNQILTEQSTIMIDHQQKFQQQLSKKLKLFQQKKKQFLNKWNGNKHLPSQESEKIVLSKEEESKINYIEKEQSQLFKELINITQDVLKNVSKSINQQMSFSQILKQSIQQQQLNQQSLLSQISQEKTKLKNLNEQFTSLTATHDEKQKSLKTLEQKQQQINAFMINLTSNLQNGIEVKQLNAKIQNLEQKLKTEQQKSSNEKNRFEGLLQVKIDQLNELSSSSNLTINSLTKDKESLNSQIQKLKQAVAATKQQKQTLHANVDELTQKLQSQQQIHQKSQEQNSKQLQQYNKLLQQQKQDNQKGLNKINQLSEGKCQMLNKQIQTLKQKITKITSQNKQLITKNTDLAGQIQHQQTNLRLQQSKNETNNQSISLLKQNSQKIEKQKQSLSMKIESLNFTIGELTGKLKNTEQDLKKSNDEKMAMQIDKKKYQEEKKVLNVELTIQKHTVESKQQQIESLKAQKNHLENHIITLEIVQKEKTALDKKLIKMQAENKVTIKEMTDKLTKEQQTNQSLKDKIIGLQNKIAQHKQTIQWLQNQKAESIRQTAIGTSTIKSTKEQLQVKIKQLENDKAKLRTEIESFKINLTKSYSEQKVGFEKEAKAKMQRIISEFNRINSKLKTDNDQLVKAAARSEQIEHESLKLSSYMVAVYQAMSKMNDFYQGLTFGKQFNQNINKEILESVTNEKMLKEQHCQQILIFVVKSIKALQSIYRNNIGKSNENYGFMLNKIAKVFTCVENFNKVNDFKSYLQKFSSSLPKQGLQTTNQIDKLQLAFNILIKRVVRLISVQERKSIELINTCEKEKLALQKQLKSDAQVIKNQMQTALNNGLAIKNQQINAMKQSLKTANSELKTKSEELTKVQEELKNLKEQTAQLKNKITQNSMNSNKQLRQEKGKLEIMKNTWGQQIEKRKKSLQQATKKMQILQQNSSELKNELIKTQKQLKSSKEQNGYLTQILQDQQNELENVRKQLENKKQQLQRKTKLHNEANTSIASLQRQAQKNDETIAKLESQIQQSEKKIYKLNQQRKQLETRNKIQIDSLKTQLNSATSTIKQIQAQLKQSNSLISKITNIFSQKINRELIPQQLVAEIASYQPPVGMKLIYSSIYHGQDSPRSQTIHLCEQFAGRRIKKTERLGRFPDTTSIVHQVPKQSNNFSFIMLYKTTKGTVFGSFSLKLKEATFFFNFKPSFGQQSEVKQWIPKDSEIKYSSVDFVQGKYIQYGSGELRINCIDLKTISANSDIKGYYNFDWRTITNENDEAKIALSEVELHRVEFE